MTDINVSVLRIVEQGDAAYKKKDYEAAERLYKGGLDLAKQTGAETNHVYSSLAKVYKKLKRYQEAYDYSRQTPTPAGFRDSAICLRQIIGQARKTKNTSLLKRTLEELYRLAVLAYLCYGPHDCKMGVRGSLVDRARIVNVMLELQQIHATYETHGTLEGGGLLTESDYDKFSSFFGESDKTYNPFLDFATLTQEVNKRYIEWLRKYYMRPPDDPSFPADPSWIRMANESLDHTIKVLKETAPWAVND